MTSSTQVGDEGTVNESRIIFIRRRTETHINYTSKRDGNARWATFDDAAIVLKDDRIRLNLPLNTVTFGQIDDWKDVKEYLREKYPLTIELDEEAPSDIYPTEVNFFLTIRTLTGQKATEIEDITRAITYTH